MKKTLNQIFRVLYGLEATILKKNHLSELEVESSVTYSRCQPAVVLVPFTYSVASCQLKQS